MIVYIAVREFQGREHVMNADHESRFIRIIRSHSARYPLMECTDIYKLIYQAAMGSAHSVRSITSAKECFEEEISNIGIGPLEPVVDIIAHDGSISRINIRPYLKAGFSSDKLIEAFARTGKEIPRSTGTLELYCGWLKSMQEEGQLTVNLRTIDQYMSEMSESGYPAVHHSSAYRNAYAPSYRVIATALISELDIIQRENILL